MADLAEPNIVHAAGGILVRGGPDPRTTTTVVIHRPRHDDWSFPKGKLDPGETAEEAALREVYEETAVRCELVLPLGVVRYPLAAGAVKHTEYWIMRPVHDDGFIAGDEGDGLRWLRLDEAVDVVTSPLDRELVVRAQRAVAMSS